jgi:hypothetical protein
MLTAVLLLLAQPGDVVQVHDLDKIAWQRAKALEGQIVRVRFTVGRILGVVGMDEEPQIVVVLVHGQGEDCRTVILPKRETPTLNGGAKLEAKGVLRVKWVPRLADLPSYVIVTLENARLVK